MLTRAIALQTQGKYREAEAIYKAVLKKTPQDINALYLFGTLLHTQNKHNDAHYFLNKAFKKASKNKDVSYAFAKNAAELKLTSIAIDAISQFIHSDKKAFRLYISIAFDNQSKLLSDNSSLFSSWQNYELGKFYYKKLLFDRAINSLSLVFQNSPRDREASFLLASALVKVGDHKRALSFYDSLIDLFPDDVDLLFDKGVVLYNRGQRQQANINFLKVLRLEKTYYRAVIYLSISYQETGDIDSSVSVLKEFLNVEPNNLTIQITLIEKLIALEEFDSAERYLSTLPSERQNDEHICVLRSRLSKYRDNMMAIEYLKSCANTDIVNLELIKRYLQQGMSKESRRQLEVFDVQKKNSVVKKAMLHTQARVELDTPLCVKDEYCKLVKSYQFLDIGSSQQLSELAKYLNERHVDSVQPTSQSVRNGTQISGVLYDFDNPIRDSLLNFVNACIDNYRLTFQEKNFSYLVPPDGLEQQCRVREGWSVNLTEGGKHAFHIHPEGTLSAVFYVELPDTIGYEGEEGYLAFGVPEFKLKKSLEPEFKVMPKEGQLVLFPSHFWHGTLPFSGSSNRLTIAFDIETVI